MCLFQWWSACRRTRHFPLSLPGFAAVLIPAAFPDPAAQRVIQVAAFQQCSTLLPAAVVRQTVLVIVVIMVAVATAVTVAVSQPRRCTASVRPLHHARYGASGGRLHRNARA